jgi:sulfite exporter TauE/SafE
MAPGAYAFAPELELAVFLVIGLLGGAHCLGMCGPLVTVYAGRLDDGGAITFGEVRQHFLFNAGRTATYALVGASMGAVGSVLYDAAAVARIANGVRGVTGILVGAAVVATGASYVRGGAAGPLARFEGAGIAGGLTDRVDDWVEGLRILCLGALHAALPCPLLFPAYLYALARGDPVEGALVLGALGVGTFPPLFVYGTVVNAAPRRWLERVHRGLGVAFLVLGYLPLSHGLVLLGVPAPVPPVHDLIYQPLDAIVDAGRYCLPG